LTKFSSPYFGLRIFSSICHLHQFVDHNGTYSISIQRRKDEEGFNLALWLGNLHQVNLVAHSVLQKKYGCDSQWFSCLVWYNL